MKARFYLAVFIFSLINCQLNAQVITLKGKVITTANAENVHVINKTYNTYTITNLHGTFEIPVRINDTLVFSSLQHELKTITIDYELFSTKTLVLKLTESITKLDEVVVGRVLTGKMASDISNVKGKPMTSLQAGIPSYQGKPLTQTQRQLKDAGDLDATLGGSLGGLGASLRIIPIINALTGRTKRFKNYVKLEAKDKLVYTLKAKYSERLFAEIPLKTNDVMAYFYFVSEQENFLKEANNQSDFLVLEYLKAQLIKFKQLKRINLPD